MAAIVLTVTGQGGARKICPHDNLACKYPELVKEWDYERNVYRPEDCPKDSFMCAKHTQSIHRVLEKKFWWQAVNSIRVDVLRYSETHRWTANIDNRVSCTGCPYCTSLLLCNHNKIAHKFHGLLEKWNYGKNEQ
jgi:hypothetical protein